VLKEREKSPWQEPVCNSELRSKFSAQDLGDYPTIDFVFRDRPRGGGRGISGSLLKKNSLLDKISQVIARMG